MQQRKELTQAFMQELFRADYHITWIYVHDNFKRGVYELHFELWDGFHYSMDIDMFDFDEQNVIYALKEMACQVYGGSD